MRNLNPILASPVVMGKMLSRGGVNREREKISICTPPPRSRVVHEREKVCFGCKKWGPPKKLGARLSLLGPVNMDLGPGKKLRSPYVHFPL